MTLDYASAITGTSNLVVRATDTGFPNQWVEAAFTVGVFPINQPPTTTGISDVNVTEDSAIILVDLAAAFSDPDEPSSDLQYSVVSNDNPSMFASTTIDPALDTLSLDLLADANGFANLTVRAVDN